MYVIVNLAKTAVYITFCVIASNFVESGPTVAEISHCSRYEPLL